MQLILMMEMKAKNGLEMILITHCAIHATKMMLPPRIVKIREDLLQA